MIDGLICTGEYQDYLGVTWRCHPKDNYYKGYFMKRVENLHRVIWELNNGPITKGYDVHHINRDKRDNRLENLSCMSVQDHCRLHRCGVPQSDETKQKIAQAHLGVSHSKPCRCVETGERFTSFKEASSKTGVSHVCIARCCRGTLKTAGKLHWEFSKSYD